MGTCTYGYILLLSIIAAVIPQEFRGGTVFWTVNNNKQVYLCTRTTWEYQSTGCDVNDTDSDITATYDEYWTCQKGCIGPLQVLEKRFICAGGNSVQKWNQILGFLKIKDPFALTSKRFSLGLSGAARISLGYGTGGAWIIQTVLNLHRRNDTGHSNRPPVTASIPHFSIVPGCKTTLTLPVFDKDDDDVRCRWATAVECGNACQNNSSSLPSGTLNQIGCTLTIDPTTSNGFVPGLNYLVAVTVQDFPKFEVKLEDGSIVNSSQSFSSIPLQFIVHIGNISGTCANVPQIRSTTPPDGSHFIVPNGTTWKQRIYVQTHLGSGLDSVTVSGPPYVKVSAVSQEKGRSDRFYVDVTWTQNPNFTGANMLCFAAFNKEGYSSAQRCFVLLSGYLDPCFSNPCQNKGQCSINFTNFTCSCAHGTYGDICQYDVDECAWSPCDNRGECFNTVGDYKCFCRPGYTGKNCTDVDVCLPNSCKGKGTCIQHGSSFDCDCFNGYSGPICQNDYDNCTSSPCENGGQCKDLFGGFICDCNPPYTGQYCEQEVDFCDPTPCQNGGLCERNDLWYVCKCPDDFIGLNCELSVKQVCNGDQSYCTCHVDGEKVQVSIPDPAQDKAYQTNLRAGVIGYPVGLLIGCGCCVFIHYAVIPRYLQSKFLKKQGSKSPGSFASLSSSSRTAVYPFAETPPPRYSSLGITRDSSI